MAKSNLTDRRHRNHLEVCKSCMTKVTRVSTFFDGTQYRSPVSEPLIEMTGVMSLSTILRCFRPRRAVGFDRAVEYNVPVGVENFSDVFKFMLKATDLSVISMNSGIP